MKVIFFFIDSSCHFTILDYSIMACALLHIMPSALLYDKNLYSYANIRTYRSHFHKSLTIRRGEHFTL